MKGIFTGLLIIVSASFIHAQWTTNASGDAINNNSSGKVGISTPSPRGQFDVAGIGDVYLVNDPNSGTAQNLFLPGHIYISPYNGGNISYLQARRLNNSGTTSLRFRTYNSGILTEAMHIEGNGNVGVGTVNPISEFQINNGYQKISLGKLTPQIGQTLGWASQYIGLNLARNTQGWIANGDGGHNGASMVMGDTFGQFRVINVPSTSGNDQILTDNQINQYTKFLIDGSGNVGIGLGTIPRSPLEVRVAGNNSSVQTGLIIQQTNPGNPNNSAGVSLDFGIGNNSGNNNIEGRITLRETYLGTRPKMLFSLWDENNTFRDRMVIDAYGNVGVNTTDPTSEFQVNSGSSKISLGKVPNQVSESLNWASQYVGLNVARSSQGWEVNSDGGHNGGTMVMGDPFGRFRIVNIPSSGTSNQVLTEAQINSNTSFTINELGNVGIGVGYADAKLAVKGTIHTQEVKVDLDGAMVPDYVFEKSYSLPSLEEVKSYVDANKHLPEVPSAKEMEANGMNLGEMNLLLLKKIEELTLYVIELKKEIEILKNKGNEQNQN